MLRDYRWTQLAQLVWNDQQHLFFSRSQSPGMPAYMYSYIKQGRSVSSLRFHIVHNCYIVNQHLLHLFLSGGSPEFITILHRGGS